MAGCPFTRAFTGDPSLEADPYLPARFRGQHGHHEVPRINLRKSSKHSWCMELQQATRTTPAVKDTCHAHTFRYLEFRGIGDISDPKCFFEQGINEPQVALVLPRDTSCNSYGAGKMAACGTGILCLLRASKTVCILCIPAATFTRASAISCLGPPWMLCLGTPERLGRKNNPQSICQMLIS